MSTTFHVFLKMRSVFLLVMLILLCHISFAGVVEKRSQIIEALNEQQIVSKTLREKIITSRALGLYLQNLLPSKGNVYTHAYEYLNELTLDSFKEAQKSSSDFMDQTLWLPLEKNKRINFVEIEKNKEAKAIIDYFVNWSAGIKVLHFVNLYLKNMILVEPIEKSLAPLKLIEFDKAYKLQDFLSKEYENQLTNDFGLSDQLQESKNKNFMKVSERILQMMKPHLELVKTKENRLAIDEFIAEVTKIQAMDLKDKAMLDSAISKIFNKDNSYFKLVEKALTSVELPSSSDIDGSEESFEVVMRLEVGYGLLKNILLNVKSW